MDQNIFVMEAGDYKLLDHPEEEILNKGGHIAFALLDGEVVGTCALVKTEDHPLTFELSKMAVSPKTQGKKNRVSAGKCSSGKNKKN